MKTEQTMHPAVMDLRSDMQKGKLSRREFMRFATLLGVSAAAAGSLAGLALPQRALAATPQRGGILKAANACQKIAHPHTVSWNANANVVRMVCEYLTYTDPQNVSHPYLLKSWQASEDLKTWTLDCQEGVKFNNGDDFSAADVVFTLNEWLNKDVGSSMLGMVGAYLDANGIETVSDYQVKLHLKRPEIAIPEHFFSYPAFVLNHRTFGGDFLKAPHGTGPFTLEHYSEGEMAKFKARGDYWQIGADGQPLPYLDGLEFYDMGQEISPLIAAMRSGDIHIINMGDGLPAPTAYTTFKDDPNFTVVPVDTANVMVLRLRADKKPWDDVRVRNALKLCQHREKIRALAYMNQGALGHDTHVYPNHPEYCKKPIPQYDPQKAKQLLSEAGYPNGVDVELSVPSDWTDVVRYAEILKQDAQAAGIRITIKTMPVSQYWEVWTEVPAGITQWAHRPLGTQVLGLGYDYDEDTGEPLPWNETRWVDKEFHDLLKKASGTLDVEARRQLFCRIEEIQMTRGTIGIAWWAAWWSITASKLHGVVAHPATYFLFNEAWLEQG